MNAPANNDDSMGDRDRRRKSEDALKRGERELRGAPRREFRQESGTPSNERPRWGTSYRQRFEGDGRPHVPYEGARGGSGRVDGQRRGPGDNSAGERGGRAGGSGSAGPRSDRGQGERAYRAGSRDDRGAGARRFSDGAAPRSERGADSHSGRSRFDRRDGEKFRSDRRIGDKADGARRDGGRPRFQRPDGARPRFERRDGDKPRFERRDGEKPRFERRDGEKRGFERRREGDKTRFDRRDGEGPRFQRPDGDRPRVERRDGDKPRFERRDGDRPRFERRDGEKRRFERRDGEKPRGERREGDKRGFDRRGDDKPRFDRRGGDKPRFERRDGDARGGERLVRDESPSVHRTRDINGPDLRQVRDEHVDPPVPEEITGKDLNGQARMELKTLTLENAEFVARHLVMAAMHIDDDPELAHQHAQSAARRAGRIAMVRETLAITAYRLGDYALALRELRTYRRISGKDDQIALMVDAERGMGRPDRALELARSVDASSLAPAERVQLAIAMSGARLDLGQTQAALSELQIPQLQKSVAYSYSPELFAAYAGVLEELGRADEAAEWRERAERAAELIEAKLNPAEAETVEIYEEELADDEAAADEPEDTSGSEAGAAGADDADAGAASGAVTDADGDDEAEGLGAGRDVGGAPDGDGWRGAERLVAEDANPRGAGDGDGGALAGRVEEEGDPEGSAESVEP